MTRRPTHDALRTPRGFFVVDRAHHMAGESHAFRDLVTAAAGVQPQALDSLREAIDVVLQTGCKWNHELPIETLDGRRMLRAEIAPVRMARGVVDAVGVYLLETDAHAA